MVTNTSKQDVLGFVDIQVGSIPVRVPIVDAGPQEPGAPIASIDVNGSAVSIFVHGDATSRPVRDAVGEAAEEALKVLSRKLLN